MKRFPTWAALIPILIVFFFLTLPLGFERPIGGRSGERQGQTAGAVRIFCQSDAFSIFRAPQVHFGNQPFNMEFPVFEWAEGKLARAIDGPRCDSVEAVSKTTNILFSALGIIAVFFLAHLLFQNQLAAVLAASALSVDHLWLKYATYSIVENRVIALASLAILFHLQMSKRRRLQYGAIASLFWTLVILQKPQIFSFFAGFWLACEAVQYFSNTEKKKVFDFLKTTALKTAPLVIAIVFGASYFLWCQKQNQHSDLPWITWMGPRHLKWFTGNWQERGELAFYKNLIFSWARKTGFIYIVPFLIWWRSRKLFQKTFLASLPFLAGAFGYLFVFLNVVKAHEYYALPLNFAAALCLGGVIAITAQHGKIRWLQIALVALFATRALTGFSQFWDFRKNVNNPTHPDYLTQWNKPIFPPGDDLVVMAVPGSQRDLLYLYLAKRRGFQWCASNPEHAPRKFWKEQGVRYVAWAKDPSADPRFAEWEVRTIDEELARARIQDWSSDSKDAWNRKTMWQWADLASRTGKDPCHPEQKNPSDWR